MPRKSAHEGGEVVSPTYRPGKYSWYSFLLDSEWIMSMKIPKDPIVNLNHDTPACSAVSQPAAQPCAPILDITSEKSRNMVMNTFISV
jgi:hypothetical protein